jgi:hypothetical protein
LELEDWALELEELVQEQDLPSNNNPSSKIHRPFRILMGL